MKNYKMIFQIEIGKLLFIIGKIMTEEEYKQYVGSQPPKEGE